MATYRCLYCNNPIEIYDEINTEELTCPECLTEHEVIIEEDEDFQWWAYLEIKR